MSDDTFPRLARYAADDEDPARNARLFRHELKNRLNTIGLLAQGLLAQRDRQRFRPEVVEFLQSIEPAVREAVEVIDLVRVLPPQPAPPGATLEIDQAKLTAGPGAGGS